MQLRKRDKISCVPMGIRKGRMPLTQGLGCPQNLFLYFPMGNIGGNAATKRTPHDESCGLFPHLHPCVPCSDYIKTSAMGHSMYSALLIFILMKISKTNMAALIIFEKYRNILQPLYCSDKSEVQKPHLEALRGTVFKQ